MCLREQISIVFQETFLFDGTLYSNIICGNRDIGRDEVIHVIKEVGLVRNLPGLSIDEILNISIIEGGRNLSGGQKRMIAIARALIKKPSVLILMNQLHTLMKRLKTIYVNLYAILKILY